MHPPAFGRHSRFCWHCLRFDLRHAVNSRLGSSILVVLWLCCSTGGYLALRNHMDAEYQRSFIEAQERYFHQQRKALATPAHEPDNGGDGCESYLRGAKPRFHRYHECVVQNFAYFDRDS